MQMHNPPHPGLSVRHDCLDALGLSIEKGAGVLDVSRQALNNLVKGHASISPEMALRLEKAGWSTADSWLRLQAQYDLWKARKSVDLHKVRKYLKKVA
jgi:addiction module HigA family antidote